MLTRVLAVLVLGAVLAACVGGSSTRPDGASGGVRAPVMRGAGGHAH